MGDVKAEQASSCHTPLNEPLGLRKTQIWIGLNMVRRAKPPCLSLSCLSCELYLYPAGVSFVFVCRGLPARMSFHIALRSIIVAE